MAISSSVSGSPESAATDIEPPCVTPTRAISHRTSTILFVRAGGRCQRRGCNARLFEHHLSKQPGNFADRAHIVAFSEGGPRGNDGPRPPDINEVDNLMALCKACHKEIDDHSKGLVQDIKPQKKRVKKSGSRMMRKDGGLGRTAFRYV